MESRKIYLVSKGDYSDYHIVSVFSTKELAELYVSKFSKLISRYDEFSIEEYDIDSFATELINKFPFIIAIDKEGNTTNVTNFYWDFEDGKSDLSLAKSGDENLTLYVHCFADDEKHAIKIASEKRFEILALNKWRNKKL